MKLKLIAAATAMAIAGVAQADINPDNVRGSNEFAAADSFGKGELFISIVARNPSNPGLNNSYVRDLGVTADTFVDFFTPTAGGSASSLPTSAQSFDMTTDTLYNQFIADNAGFDVSYNMLAVHNSEETDFTTFNTINRGFLTTSTNELGPNDGPQFGQFTQAEGNIGDWLNEVNNLHSGDFSVDDSSRAPASSLAFHDAVNWGNTDVFGIPTEGSFDNPLSFYFIGYADGDFSQSREPQKYGSWTLASNGELTFAPVPIPAAVWLFGAGLMGLVGVARRRRNS